ncbi:MAG: NADPH:quinone reductase [Piptocephalis tieghemiana]|nr:MAG: NADPH:quinone reductase [Piptocephalis tieghemiana]
MPEKMQAILTHKDGGAEQLYVGEVEVPVPRPGELLVRVKAIGVNRMDILQREGRYPLPPGISPIMGVEFAGVVERVGGDEEDREEEAFPIGSRVFGLVYGGAYAQYCLLPRSMAMLIPEGMGFTEAAAIPEAWITAYQALGPLGQLAPHERVLIHAGGSGVGVAAIQLARSPHFQASRVLTTAGSEAKLRVCRELGAHRGVNYREEEFSKVLEEEGGVDLIVDFIGSSYWQGNLNSLRLDGRLVLLAIMSGARVPDTDISPILRKRLRIIGSTLRSRSPEYQAELLEGFKRHVLPGLSGGDDSAAPLRIIIDRTYPWHEVRKAHEHMEANGNIGKIVLVVDEE